MMRKNFFTVAALVAAFCSIETEAFNLAAPIETYMDDFYMPDFGAELS